MPRPLTDEERKDLRDRFLAGLQGIVAGSPGNTLGGIPVSQFLAAPPPGDPFGDWQHKAGRAVCDRWARGDRATIFPGRDVYYRNLCEPYLGADTPGSPTFGPPFEGGQCPGVRYTFVWDVFEGPNLVFSDQSSDLIGPLRLDTTVPPADVNLCQNSSVGPYAVWVMRGASAAVSMSTGCGIRVVVKDVFPTFGGPNNCGDPESLFDPGDSEPSPDPNPGPVGGPTGFPFPGFDVTINPDGTITVDFGDGLGPVTIDPGIDPTPTGRPPGDVGEPADPVGTGAGGDGSGEAPDGSFIGALKIAIVSAPDDARRYTDTVYRAACYIYFGTVEGLELDPSGAMLQDGQLVLPPQEGLTRWQVNANSGYNLSITPYYIEA